MEMEGPIPVPFHLTVWSVETLEDGWGSASPRELHALRPLEAGFLFLTLRPAKFRPTIIVVVAVVRTEKLRGKQTHESGPAHLRAAEL